MEELIKEILQKHKDYSPDQIEVRPYCKGRMEERKIDKEILISTLLDNKSLYYAEEQDKTFQGKSEKRYKLIFKISSRYSLIIITAYYPKILKVINVIKTSKGAEKKWRKKILK